jgi:hypothetical protein
MKVNHKERLTDLIEDLEIWAIDVLENEFPDAEEIYEKFGVEKAGDLISERIIKTKAVGDRLVFNDLILARITMGTLAGIKSNINALQEYARQIIGIFQLGFHFGYNSAQEPDHTKQELYKNYCHRKISSEIVKERRWGTFSPKKRTAIRGNQINKY